MTLAGRSSSDIAEAEELVELAPGRLTLIWSPLATGLASPCSGAAEEGGSEAASSLLPAGALASKTTGTLL